MSGESPAGGTPEKVTVNLSAPSALALARTMELTGATKTEAINRALRVVAHLEETWAAGGAVYVRDTPGSEIERLRIF